MKKFWVFFLLAGCISFGNNPSPSDISSPNYSGDRFVNNIETREGFDGIIDVLGDALFGDEIRAPKEPIETAAISFDTFDPLPESELRVTWLGHSTMVVEIESFVVLTDPIWDTINPPGIHGIDRFFKNPLAFDELPQVDAVVISHDHYDHLDLETTLALADTGTTFLVPVGVDSHLREWGIPEAQIVARDWWETWSNGEGLEIIATPARHFSGRSFTQNKTLWSSWAIVTESRRVFFGGDTGMTPEFTDIGKKYGPFDMSLMPIGAYGEGWPDIHLNPEEAVEAHKMVRGGVMVPIHWGTFQLAFHDWFEPPERMIEAAEKAGVKYAVPKPGEPVDVTRESKLERWWLQE